MERVRLARLERDSKTRSKRVQGANICVYVCVYVYIYIYIMCTYIYIYIYKWTTTSIRELGGAPRNPAPRNRFLAWIVKPSGCHCTGAFGGATTVVEC